MLIAAAGAGALSGCYYDPYTGYYYPYPQSPWGYYYPYGYRNGYPPSLPPGAGPTPYGAAPGAGPVPYGAPPTAGPAPYEAPPEAGGQAPYGAAPPTNLLPGSAPYGAAPSENEPVQRAPLPPPRLSESKPGGAGEV
jgi:hypothetical protein